MKNPRCGKCLSGGFLWTGPVQASSTRLTVCGIVRSGLGFGFGLATVATTTAAKSTAGTAAATT
jgi:hypothetical protein